MHRDARIIGCISIQPIIHIYPQILHQRHAGVAGESGTQDKESLIEHILMAEYHRS